MIMDERFFQKLGESIEHYFEEKSSHGFDHALRVYNNVLMLATGEPVDLDIVRASAMLHDVARHKQEIGKIACHAAEGAKMAEEILRETDFPPEKIPAVAYAIKIHRYSKGTTPETIEAATLQDADRLEALGAICIARVFSYGAKKDRPMYDPSISPEDEGEYSGEVSLTSINHFYLKILKITPESFNLRRAQGIAKKRYQVILDFIENFKKEWNGES